MPRAIIISHPSELIRKGLLGILENEILAKIYFVNNIHKTIPEFLSPHSELVLIVPADSDPKEFYDKIGKISGHIYVAGVSLDETQQYSDHFDHVFHINQSSDKFIQCIKDFFSDSQDISDDEELSNREKDVLKLIALGHTNKAIADKLFISAHTVISHRKNITDKLGIKSVPGLTVYAIIKKIISQADITNDQLD